jgi:hypothetical protein
MLRAHPVFWHQVNANEAEFMFGKAASQHLWFDQPIAF